MVRTKVEKNSSVELERKYANSSVISHNFHKFQMQKEKQEDGNHSFNALRACRPGVKAQKGERVREESNSTFHCMIHKHITRIVLLAKYLLKIFTLSAYKQFEKSVTTIFIAVFKK